MSFLEKQISKAAELATQLILRDRNFRIDSGNPEIREIDAKNSGMSGAVFAAAISKMAPSDKIDLYEAIKYQLTATAKEGRIVNYDPFNNSFKRQEKASYIEVSSNSRGGMSTELEIALQQVGFLKRLPTAYGMLPSMTIFVYDDGEITVSDRDKNQRDLAAQIKDKTRDNEPRIDEYDYVAIDYPGKPATPKRLKSLDEIGQNQAVEFKFTGEQTLVKAVPIGTIVREIRDGKVQEIGPGTENFYTARGEERHVVLEPGTYPPGLSPNDIDRDDVGITRRRPPQYNPIVSPIWQATEIAPGVYEPKPIKFYRVTEPVSMNEGFYRVTAKPGDWLSVNNGPSGTDAPRLCHYTAKALEEMIAAGKIVPVPDEHGRGSKSFTQEAGEVPSTGRVRGGKKEN